VNLNCPDAREYLLKRAARGYILPPARETTWNAAPSRHGWSGVPMVSVSVTSQAQTNRPAAAIAAARLAPGVFSCCRRQRPSDSRLAHLGAGFRLSRRPAALAADLRGSQRHAQHGARCRSSMRRSSSSGDSSRSFVPDCDTTFRGNGGQQIRRLWGGWSGWDSNPRPRDYEVFSAGLCAVPSDSKGYGLLGSPYRAEYSALRSGPGRC
jgi:hypothetical protein